MVAAVGGVDVWRAAKFAGADDDCLVEQFARAQLADERGEGGIENGVLRDVGFVVVGVKRGRFLPAGFAESDCFG